MQITFMEKFLLQKIISKRTKKITKKDIGKSIVEKFKNINPLNVPGALVSDHGPFTWGEAPLKSVENAAVLEYIAD